MRNNFIQYANGQTERAGVGWNTFLLRRINDLHRIKSYISETFLWFFHSHLIFLSVIDDSFSFLQNRYISLNLEGELQIKKRSDFPERFNGFIEGIGARL